MLLQKLVFALFASTALAAAFPNPDGGYPHGDKDRPHRPTCKAEYKTKTWVDYTKTKVYVTKSDYIPVTSVDYKKKTVTKPVVKTKYDVDKKKYTTWKHVLYTKTYTKVEKTKKPVEQVKTITVTKVYTDYEKKTKTIPYTTVIKKPTSKVYTDYKKVPVTRTAVHTKPCKKGYGDHH